MALLSWVLSKQIPDPAGLVPWKLSSLGQSLPPRPLPGPGTLLNPLAGACIRQASNLAGGLRTKCQPPRGPVPLMRWRRKAGSEPLTKGPGFTKGKSNSAVDSCIFPRLCPMECYCEKILRSKTQ